VLDRHYRDYRAKDRNYDELIGRDGKVRSHWQRFVERLGGLDDAEIERAWASAERQIREIGVTHNVHGDPQGEDRPWRLDPVPFVIDAAEWQALEAGLVQRAKLLNTILADLYGEQRLLRAGLIPPALIFANSRFLRPVHGVPVESDTYLHFLAIDLARGPDGRWWVLSDRTQSPVGAGYALENRVIMARALPELFRDCRVQRLAAFFQGFRDDLISRIRSDEPRIVIHSPGPSDETYFEHAYLARYLGIPLVEAADLTVRDRRVFLKTLSGLKPVHMIWRRVLSEGYDPLSLQAGSLHGIPGLVEALRAGQVTVVNALGSGVVENDALMNFMPKLCRQLLGEDLILPQTATWWCGDQDSRRFVLDHLEKLVIRPTFASRSIMEQTPSQVIGGHLTQAERQELAARIEEHGEAYIGQDLVTLSTAPTWQDDRLAPQPMALRVYLAASGDGYRVMPGGLTRTSEHPDPHAVFMGQGEASKDSWVLANGVVSGFSRLAVGDHPPVPKRSGQDVPSRTADNLYWLGRYAERIEGGARLLRSFLRLTAGEESDENPATRQILLDLMIEHHHLSEDLARTVAAGGLDAVERELWSLVFDPEAVNGLGPMLANLRRSATSVRERLSSDTWRILQELQGDAEARRQQARPDVQEALQLLNHVIRMLAALAGMQTENTTRNFGWLLFDLGRRVERARLLTKLIAALAGRGGEGEVETLELLLQLADSSMTYRTRYLAEPQAPLVIDLILMDETNPRAIMFQLDRLAEHLDELPRDAELEGLSDEQRLLSRLHAKVDLVDLAKLAELSGKKPTRQALLALMSTVEADLSDFSDTLTSRYFSHVEPLSRAGAIWLGTPR
jgi:uncharacterized circularly permuted ATP-grasp superfamily protein/uncharacterized alpha-E superfamily protein